MGYLCESPYISFYIHGPTTYFALFLIYVDITKLFKFKMPTKCPFKNCLLPKINAEHIIIFFKLNENLIHHIIRDTHVN